MNRFLEWLLRLTPGELSKADWRVGFAASYNNWIVFGMVVALAALGVLTVVSYLREGETARKHKLTLAGIRMAVILLIVAILFQPNLMLQFRQQFYSTVVVLVDDSLSMSLKDRYGDPEQRQAVAGKLGVTADELTTLTRTEIVRRLVAKQNGPLAQLAKDHPMVVLRFSTNNPGQEAYTQQLELIDYTRSGDKAITEKAAKDVAAAFGKLSAGGYETNLASSLRDAADRLQGRRPAGIIIISDGQNTGDDAGDRLPAALAYVRQRGTPIFALGVGDKVPPKNVALLQLQGPGEVRYGSNAEFTAYLSNRNCADQEVEIRLAAHKADAAADVPWTPVAEPVKVKLSGKPGSREAQSDQAVIVVNDKNLAQLTNDKKDLGEYVFRAEVLPLDGEYSTEDNAATTKIKVSDEKIKVLLVSADAGWEFQYLRNLLLRDPEQYAVSVWQQDAEKEFNQEASSGMKLTQLPRTLPDMFKYEVVILYDPAYTENGFDETFVKMLDEFVSVHHGGLCYIASNKNSEKFFIGNLFQTLAAVLPVKLERPSPNFVDDIARVEPTGWRVVPTAPGRDHPVMRLGRTVDESANIFNILPGVFTAHPVAKLKTLATALAIYSDPMKQTSEAPAEPLPVVAVQYYGRGRSLYIGTDETWRWRYLNDSLYYQKFWHNVMDFLSAGRLQKKRVVISTGADRFSIGEKTRIRVEAYSREYQPVEESEFIVSMVDLATGKPTPLKLNLDAKAGKGHYEAEVSFPVVGRFELTVEGDDYKDNVAGKTITVTLPEDEFRHPESNFPTLLTASGAGKFLEIQDADKLSSLVPANTLNATREEKHQLWDVPLAIVVIVALLALEWILRKRHNMA